MRIEQLLEFIGDREVFRVDELPRHPGLAVELHRWVKKGYLVRLRRGVYKLGFGPPAGVVLLSNTLVPGSYVTGRAALEFHGILREPFEGEVEAVTSGRPLTLELEGRTFHYRQIALSPLAGLVADTKLQVATPATAIFDLCHLKTHNPVFKQNEMFYEKFEEEPLWEIARSCHQRGNLCRVVGKLALRIRQRKALLLRKQKRRGRKNYSQR